MAVNFNTSLNFSAGANFNPGFYGSSFPTASFGSPLFGGFDRFSGSAGMMDGFGSLGGLGGGFGNPMMGLNSFGGANPQQLMGAMNMLGRLLGMMAGQGQRGPGFGGFGGPQGFGGPGGAGAFAGPGGAGAFAGPGGAGAFAGPGGFGGPGAMCGPGGMQGPGGAGRTMEMQKGSTFTTPGGATISWQGDEVKVKEPGGSVQSANGGGRSFGAGNGQFNMAAAYSGPGFSSAMAVSTNMGGMGAAGCGCHQAGKDAKPREWRVWGDPHIDHPNGSKSDFDKKNAIFTLQDGTQILMGADNPKGVVQKVQIVLPGGQPNWNAGYDPNQTSVMRDDGTGHFNSVGTASQFMQGGFGNGFPGQFGFA